MKRSCSISDGSKQSRPLGLGLDVITSSNPNQWPLGPEILEDWISLQNSSPLPHPARNSLESTSSQTRRLLAIEHWYPTCFAELHHPEKYKKEKRRRSKEREAHKGSPVFLVHLSQIRSGISCCHDAVLKRLLEIEGRAIRSHLRRDKETSLPLMAETMLTNRASSTKSLFQS